MCFRVNWVLLALLLSVPARVWGQGATLGLSAYRLLSCPDANASVVFYLGNYSSGVAQTIPANTVLTLTFSAPAVDGPIDRPMPSVVNVAGNTTTVTFLNSVTVAKDSFLVFGRIQLNLQGVPERTPVTVAITSSPASALTLSPPGNSAVVAITSSGSCPRSPTLASTVTVDDLANTCPSADEVAAFNSAITITRDSDPTGGTLVCRAANGSADLTRLQERTYQALRLMQQLSFDAPLLWTSKSLYDWFVGAIHGIRYRSDISFSFCCDPAGVINIETNNLGVLAFTTPAWLGSHMVLLVHEARHNEGLPHTCGGNDQTLSELGAWGVQYYLQEWMAFRSGEFLIAKPTSLAPGYYQQWFWNGSVSTLSQICERGAAGIAVSPSRLEFGNQPVGVMSAARAVAITSTPGLATITGASLSGPQAADFILNGNCAGVVLPPSCVVSVSFRPTAPGLRTASLAVTVAGSALPEMVALSGNGGGAVPCAYQLSGSVRSYFEESGTGNVSVTAGEGCSWTATSHATWLSVNSGSSGNGSGTVVYTVALNPGPDARQGTLTIAGQTFAVIQGSSFPAFAAAGLVNAASFTGTPPAVGSIATLFGTNFATGEFFASMLPLQTTLGGITVRLNNIAAPLFYVGPSQINFTIPWELLGQSTVTMTVTNNIGTSASVMVNLSSLAPGIFTTNQQGIGQGAVLISNTPTFAAPMGSIPGSAARPANRGEFITIFCTGLGDVSNRPASGAAAGGNSRTTATPRVSIGGASNFVNVSFSGLAPGFAGLYQIDVQVPANAPTGNAVPVAVSIGGASATTVTIAVAR